MRGIGRVILAFVVAANVPFVAADDEANAHPIAGTIDSYGPSQFHAALNISVELAGIQFESAWRATNVTANINVAKARIILLNWPTTRIDTNPTSPTGKGETDADPQPEPSIVQDETYSGRVVLQTDRPAASIRLLPAENGHMIRSVVNLTGASGIDPPYHYEATTSFFAPTFQSRTLLPSGTPGLLHGHVAGPFNLSAHLLTYAYGSNIAFPDSPGHSTWRTGEFPHDGAAISDPLGYTTTGYYDRFFTLIISNETQVSLPDLESWQLATQRLEGTAAGDLAFTNVDPHTTVDHQYLNESLGLLQVKGSFALNSSFESGHAHWGIAGDASFVAGDAKTIVGMRFQVLPVALVAGGIGIVGIGAIYVVRKGLLIGLAGRTRTNPLDSSTRLRMLEAASQQPGITTSQLQEALGIRKPSITFHAGLLLRAGALEKRRIGNRDHYWAHPGSLNFRAPKSDSPLAGWRTPKASRVMGALAHPVRHLIFETLRACGGKATFAQLQERWKENAAVDAPSRRLFTYHAHELVRLGIIGQERRGREAVWTALVDYDALVARQQARSGIPRQADALQDAIPKHGAASESEIVKAMSGKMSGMQVRTALLDLVARGVLQYEARHKRYSLPASPLQSDDGVHA
jgi:DNA-binding transcriptional ArsR family regulator